MTCFPIFVCILLLCHCVSFNNVFVLTPKHRQQGSDASVVWHSRQEQEGRRRRRRRPLNTNNSRHLLQMTGKDQREQENGNDDTNNQIAAGAAAAAQVAPPSSGKGLPNRRSRRSDQDVGGYDPSERIGDGINVGDPQIKVKEKERSVTSILKELAAIQQQGPQKYCILGTRHCSFLHQQIIELLYVYISANVYAYAPNIIARLFSLCSGRDTSPCRLRLGTVH